MIRRRRRSVQDYNDRFDGSLRSCRPAPGLATVLVVAERGADRLVRSLSLVLSVAAIGRVRFPTIEVDISNPERRGPVSETARVSHGMVTGFGLAGITWRCAGSKTCWRQRPDLLLVCWFGYMPEGASSAGSSVL